MTAASSLSAEYAPRHDTSFGRTATEWARRIRHIRDALNALHGPCESGFVAIGSQLGHAQDTTQTLAEAAAGLAEAMGTSWMRDTVARLERDLLALNKTLKAEAADTDLEQVNGAADAIGNAVQALAKLIGQVRVLATNARIEASKLNDLNVDFTVFTSQMGHLASGGEESIAGIQEALSRLRSLLTGTMTLRDNFQKSHEGEMGDIISQLQSSMETLHSRQNTARSSLGDIPQTMTRVRTALSEVVGGLQIADITRQRLEHVGEALDTVLDLLNQSSGDSDMGGQRRTVMVNALCSLQSKQLGAIAAEFRTKSEGVATNLKTLADSINDLDEGVTRVNASASGDHGASFLTGLQAGLSRADDILCKYSDARQETEAGMTQVADMSSDMAKALTAINDIDADMHLIGLNASIKCGNMGTRGRALNVVATELQGFARQSRAIARDIAIRLDEISRASEKLSRQEDSDTRSLIDNLKEVLTGFADGLTTTRATTDEKLAVVTGNARSLVQAIEDSIRTFAIRDTMVTTLQRSEQSLAEIANQCRPGLTGRALEDARKDLLDFLHQHYTMVSERRIHEALFQESAQGNGQGNAQQNAQRSPLRSTARTAPRPSSSPPSEPDISDLLF